MSAYLFVLRGSALQFTLGGFLVLPPVLLSLGCDAFLPVFSSLALQFKSVGFLILRPDVFLSACLYACPLHTCRHYFTSGGFFVFSPVFLPVTPVFLSRYTQPLNSHCLGSYFQSSCLSVCLSVCLLACLYHRKQPFTGSPQVGSLSFCLPYCDTSVLVSLRSILKFTSFGFLIPCPVVFLFVCLSVCLPVLWGSDLRFTPDGFLDLPVTACDACLSVRLTSVLQFTLDGFLLFLLPPTCLFVLGRWIN